MNSQVWPRGRGWALAATQRAGAPPGRVGGKPAQPPRPRGGRRRREPRAPDVLEAKRRDRFQQEASPRESVACGSGRVFREPPVVRGRPRSWEQDWSGFGKEGRAGLGQLRGTVKKAGEMKIWMLMASVLRLCRVGPCLLTTPFLGLQLWVFAVAWTPHLEQG